MLDESFNYSDKKRVMFVKLNDYTFFYVHVLVFHMAFCMYNVYMKTIICNTYVV